MAEHTRRKLFGSGAALVTGVLGLGFIGGRLAPPEAPPHNPEQAVDASADGVVRRIELRLYGRGWQLISDAPRATWVRPARGQSSIVFGELFDGPETSAGKKIGELYATCTCVNAPFGAGPLAATAVEQHTLNLDGGTLTGMGTSQGDEGTFAIVGGTGRYAGARGSYVARQSPRGRGGDGTADFIATITLDGSA